MTGTPTWHQRLRITSNIIHVGAFVVAASSAFFSTGLTLQAGMAFALGVIGIGMSLTVPIPFEVRALRPYIFVGISIAMYVVAAALTGGLASGYVLMPVAAIFLAAVGGGIRAAGPAAVESVIGVVIIGATSTVVSPGDIVRISAIYALTAVAFGEIQRAISTESERSENLLLATDAASTRSERLTTTHDLLEDLVTVATSPDINAVATAHDALRDVGVITPAASAQIIADGDVVLARRGPDVDGHPDSTIPIAWQGRQLARLDLWTGDSPLSPEEVEALEITAAPVGLAIDNDLLLQRIAGITIQRERVRLARELHDDIAPSIASVGLALDMALMTGDLSEEQTRNLDATRSNVTRLVDTIRMRVQDLRADRSLSIVELAHSLVAEVDADGPTVVVDIDERTPPRPAIAAEVGALVSESFRNAVHHADASMITITGRITEAGGTLTVEDNGAGFDPDREPESRFGLVGMRERANLIGATLEVATSIGTGTSITMTWEEDR
ncbi:MAG: histidine kinase [Actinomycetia bacterium]|nr:histidine kinase [Actinomycetes bacterium]